MNTMNVTDIAAIGILLVGMYTGVRRGLSGELARVIAAIAAFYAAKKFATPAAEFVMQHREMPQEHAYLWSFVIILISAFILMWILRLVLQSLMTFAFRGRIERIGGAICGFLRASIIIAVLIIMLSFVPQENIRIPVTQESHVGRFVCKHLLPVYDNLQQRVPELKLPPATVEAETIQTEDTEMPQGEVEQAPIWDDTSGENNP